MTIKYLTEINETNKSRTLLLIDAALQAYNAFDSKAPLVFQEKNCIAPSGYEFVDYWTGFDSLFGKDKTEEIYGVVFRSEVAPYTYIFAFRGTDSTLDVLDDLGAEHTDFAAFDPDAKIPPGVKVESGFYDIYSTSAGEKASMRDQLFQLIKKYESSAKPIHQLLITGHSLGSTICEVFTLDVALSRPDITAININYACPRLGNDQFVSLYEQQPAQKNSETRTLRVQNTYDKVPCVPLLDMGYQHLNNAYIIAFHKVGLLGEFDFLSCHSALNYQAVLKGAAASKDGVCVDKDLYVSGNKYSVVSQTPDPSTIGSVWS